MRSLPHHAIPFPKAATLTSYDTLSRLLIARFPRGLVSSLQSKFVGPLTGWFMLVPGGFSATIPFSLHGPKADMLFFVEKKKKNTHTHTKKNNAFFSFVTLTLNSVVCSLFPTLLAFCR